MSFKSDLATAVAIAAIYTIFVLDYAFIHWNVNLLIIKSHKVTKLWYRPLKWRYNVEFDRRVLIGKSETRVLQLRNITRSCDKTSVRSGNRPWVITKSKSDMKIMNPQSMDSLSLMGSASVQLHQTSFLTRDYIRITLPIRRWLSYVNSVYLYIKRADVSQ